MTTIDDFFSDALVTAAELSHPRLTDLKAALNAGQQFEVEVYRPAGMTGLIKTKIYVRCTDTGNIASFEEDWNKELNSGLIRLGIRAKDEQNEALRFAFGLRDSMLSVERKVGNGYFNAVLLDLVKESNLEVYPSIKNVLQFTYHDKIEQNKRYHNWRDSIAFCISGRARELTKNLNYTPEEAKRILPEAIAEYIDNRFSVSSRRKMGLL